MEVTDFHSRTTPILSESGNDVRTSSPTDRRRKRSNRKSEPTSVQQSRCASSSAKTPPPSRAHIQKLRRQLHIDILKTRVMIAEVNLKMGKLQLLEDECLDENPAQIKRVRSVSPGHQFANDSKQSCHTKLTQNEANQSRNTSNQLQTNPVLSRTERRRRIEELEKELQHLKNQEHLSELPFPKHITNSLQTKKKPVRPLPQPAETAATAQMCSPTLPEFSGGSEDWLKYKAAYDRTKQNFSDIKNAERIKKSLRGEAFVLNVHMMSNNNPDYIMRELEQLYGRTDNIAYAGSKNLLPLPVCTESPMDICVFADKMKNEAQD